MSKGLVEFWKGSFHFAGEPSSVGIYFYDRNINVLGICDLLYYPGPLNFPASEFSTIYIVHNESYSSTPHGRRFKNMKQRWHALSVARHMETTWPERDVFGYRHRGYMITSRGPGIQTKRARGSEAQW